MDRSLFGLAFPAVRVKYSFPESGQKYVFLIDHPDYGESILKIVKEMGPRISREIEIAKNSNVTQIPRVFEFDTKSIGSDSFTYIIEQYIDGNTLAVEFRKPLFPLEKSINLLESLLQTVV